MSEDVLFVDDDPKILEAYRRNLGDRYKISTALGPNEGCEALAQGGPYAVIVSDMRMPGMNGIEFLKRVRQAAPQTVRVMLTGHADLATAVQAVNEGNIFRFLSKPCRAETLSSALDAAVQQYRLQTLEQELLENTLRSSIQVMSEILSLVSPMAFGRSARIRPLVDSIARQLHLAEPWQLEVAAMMSQLGCVIIPDGILENIGNGHPLSPNQWQTFQTHPALGASLLAQIPRLEEVAAIVAYQQKAFDGSGPPADSCAGESIPVGARVLKAVLDFDMYERQSSSPFEALLQLRRCRHHYDPAVLQALETALNARSEIAVRQVSLNELEDGMVLADDILAVSGKLVASKGHEVTASLRHRLVHFSGNTPLRQPFYVLTGAGG